MHEQAPTASGAAIVEVAYAAWLWLDERTSSFPALARRQLGHRLLDAALDALAATTDATYLPRGEARTSVLRHASRRLTVLRILLRGARDRRHLSTAQHEHAMRLVDDWGRQIGGWLRSEEARESRERRRP
jgi:hypothetical protein